MKYEGGNVKEEKEEGGKEEEKMMYKPVLVTASLIAAVNALRVRRERTGEASL